MNLPRPRELWTLAKARRNGLAGQVVAAFALKVVAAVLAFALSLLVARIYGPAGVGIYAVAVTTITLAGNLALLGQDFVTLRSVAAELAEGKQGVARGVVGRSAAITLLSGGLASLIVLLAHRQLAAIVGDDRLAPTLLAVLPALIGIAMMRLSSWALRGAGDVVRSQILEGPANNLLAVLLLAGLAVAMPGLPVWVAAACYSSSMVMVALLGWGFWRQQIAGWLPAVPQAARPLLLAGLPMTVSVLANFATDWAATLSTSHFLGPEITGQLRVALQVTALFNLINVAFDAMLGPQIAAGWRLNDRARVERICGLSTLGMVGMALPLFLAVMLAPEWILGLFGAEFRDGAPMLRILAVGQLIALAGGPVGTILIMSGHDRWLMISSFSSLAVLALLCLVAVPLLGPVGGAVAVAGTMLYRRVIAALVVRFALGLKLMRLR